MGMLLNTRLNQKACGHAVAVFQGCSNGYKMLLVPSAGTKLDFIWHFSTNSSESEDSPQKNAL